MSGKHDAFVTEPLQDAHFLRNAAIDITGRIGTF